MVFPGRLSTGCRQCRRRKVKCDEKKPTCDRCALYGRPCPGYDDAFLFRPQETATKRAVQKRCNAAAKAASSDAYSSFITDPLPPQRPRGGGVKKRRKTNDDGIGNGSSPTIITWSARPAPPPKSSSSVRSSSFSSTSSASPTSSSASPTSSSSPRQSTQFHRCHHVSPPASIPPDYDQLSLYYFMSRFVAPGKTSSSSSPSPSSCFPLSPLAFFNNNNNNTATHDAPPPSPSDPFPGHLSFLFDLYSHSEPKGPLEHATLAAAQMTTYHRWGNPRLQRDAYRNRGMAIRMLAESLSLSTCSTSVSSVAAEEGEEEEEKKIDEQQQQNVKARIDDKTIGTVLLLCTFADISGEQPSWPNIHSAGLYHLLERRGKEQFESKTGTEMFFLGVVRLHVNCFLTNDYTYADPGGYSQHLSSILPTWPPGSQHHQHQHQHLHILGRAAALVSHVPRLRRELTDHLLSLEARFGSSRCRRRPQGEEGSSDAQHRSPLGLADLPLDEVVDKARRCFAVLTDLDEWDRAAGFGDHGGGGGVGCDGNSGRYATSSSPFAAPLETPSLASLSAGLLSRALFSSGGNSGVGGWRGFWGGGGNNNAAAQQQGEPSKSMADEGVEEEGGGPTPTAAQHNNAASPHPPRHHNTHTACTLILLRASRIILCISLLEYLSHLSTWLTEQLSSPSPSSSLFPWSSSSSSLLPNININNLNLAPHLIAHLSTHLRVPALRDAVSSSATDILERLLPYAVGDLDETGRPGTGRQDAAAGLVILYPLLLVVNCPSFGVSESQRRAGRAALGRLSGSMGIKGAEYGPGVFGLGAWGGGDDGTSGDGGGGGGGAGWGGWPAAGWDGEGEGGGGGGGGGEMGTGFVCDRGRGMMV